ncbi:hypothetical protein KY285_031195 [Solanum tuberosum]|nr:hypothetical protein KY285_031195 [Solanum tuberosum]
MSMTMFGVKVEERKEGKNGQPSIGLVYRHPSAKIGFTPAYPDLCTAWRLFSLVTRIDRKKWSPYNWKTYKEAYEEILQTGSALGALGIEHGAQIGIYGANCPWWIVVTEFHIGFCTVAAAAPPIFFKGKLLTMGNGCWYKTYLGYATNCITFLFKRTMF